MNVGDYVRTKYGITQYKEYETTDGTKLLCMPVKDGSQGIFANIEDVIKSSPQIIDLIEVGDYVNDNCVIEAVPKDKRKKQIIIVDSTCAEYGDLPLNNKDIKTVVTHEQMEAMQYRVEE